MTDCIKLYFCPMMCYLVLIMSGCKVESIHFVWRKFVEVVKLFVFFKMRMKSDHGKIFLF